MTLNFSPVLAMFIALSEVPVMADDLTASGGQNLTIDQIEARRKASGDAAHQMKMEGMPCDSEHADLHDALNRGEISQAQFTAALLERIKPSPA